MDTATMGKNIPNNTADYSAKIRPIRSLRKIWSQPQSDVWLHLKGTVLIHEVNTVQEIIKRFIPAEKVRVIEIPGVKKIRKRFWISLLLSCLGLITIIIGHYFERTPKKDFFTYFFWAWWIIILVLPLYYLSVTRHAVVLRLEYNMDGFANELLYRPGKNKKLDEFLYRLSEVQKIASEVPPFHGVVIEKAIPPYKQPFYDQRLKGIFLGVILGSVILAFQSMTAAIYITAFCFVIVFVIILFKLIVMLDSARTFPKIINDVIKLHAKREYEKAVQILTIFLEQNPSSPDAWCYLIHSQTRLRCYAEAHDSLNKMSSLPYANAYKIEKLNEQIQSWKIIIERMGNPDPENILPAR